jgi:hypothetical protein
MKHTLSAAALAVASIFCAASANAGTISGLVNTGLEAQGTQDTSYKLTAASSDTAIPNQYGYVAFDNVWPISPWLANDGVSRWITPTASQGQSFDASAAGTYTYHLDFDLTGYNAATASFVGRFAADNAAEVKLNGVTIANASGFTSWNAFGASSGFHAGLNSLDFVVTNWAQNGGNPTGLRVEFSQSSITAVPEPSTWSILACGLVVLALQRRRKSRKGN